MTAAMQFHPLAGIFPLIEGKEFEALVDDIRWRGLHEPVVLYQNQILDGRNRYRACQEAGTDCLFKTYDGDDPLAYVISLNLLRRHLNESQRAMVAGTLANMRQGERTDLPSANLQKVDRASAARMLNVSERSVATARDVREHGAPELIRAVERGSVSVSAAADIATQPIEDQQEIVARGEREILRAAQAIRSRKAEARRIEQYMKLATISNANAPLPAYRQFPVLLADPPYRFDHHRSVTREPENHYPTMPHDEICALPVAELVTPDAVLFLWTPAPMLPEALGIMRAWGFEYVTSAVWVKDKIGLGTYLRHQHELLLIGNRGNHIARACLSSSVISAPRGRHSEKPSEVHELIERMYPELPKIELFARGQRNGWEVWGNQAGAA